MGGDTASIMSAKSDYPKLSAKPVGKLIPNLYKSRITQFYSGGQYEHNNLRAYVTSIPPPKNGMVNVYQHVV